MLFIFNIVMIIILSILKLFCVIITFKVLKYEDDYYEFYEGNPISRKILNCRGGKILLVFLVYLFPFGFFIGNFIAQIFAPKSIWIVTLGVIIILPVYILIF